MKTFKCWEVLGHTDTAEGSMPMKVVVRFTEYEEAERFVRSKAYSRWCVMGYQTPSDVKNCIRLAEIVICENVREYEDQCRSEVRTRALNKLTEEERQALGF